MRCTPWWKGGAAPSCPRPRSAACPGTRGSCASSSRGGMSRGDAAPAPLQPGVRLTTGQRHAVGREQLPGVYSVPPALGGEGGVGQRQRVRGFADRWAVADGVTELCSARLKGDAKPSATGAPLPRFRLAASPALQQSGASARSCSGPPCHQAAHFLPLFLSPTNPFVRMQPYNETHRCCTRAQCTQRASLRWARRRRGRRGGRGAR